LGSIKLPQAQIGRQNSQAVVEADESGEEQMRYAFLILEPKRNDASKMVRHVLCSQSDEDRDEWINALLYYVALDPEPSQGPSEKASRGKRLQRRQQDHDSTPSDSATGTPIDTPVDGELISIRYDHMASGKRPSTAKDDSSLRSPTFPDDASRLMPRSPDNRLERPNVPQRSPYRAPISGPINGAPITDEAAWSSTQREEERRREEKRAKKRSIWGLLSKGMSIHFGT
jgi:RalA-binding protein 1